MAISGPTRHRCQISKANARLFRYNLAEVSHPTDINILIKVTIYSNNLTILTHAEQMGWGRGPARELGWGGTLAETGGLLGGAEGKVRGFLPLPASRLAPEMILGPHSQGNLPILMS